MKARKGFTLLELMVCLTIMTILGLAAVLAANEVAASAKAARIINNLEMMKNAALAYWADNTDAIRQNPLFFNDANIRSQIIAYVSRTESDRTSESGSNQSNPYLRYYDFKVFTNNGVAKKENRYPWYVYYDGNELKNDESLRQKLESRAKTYKLLNNPQSEETPYTNKGPESKVVYLRVK